MIATKQLDQYKHVFDVSRPFRNVAIDNFVIDEAELLAATAAWPGPHSRLWRNFKAGKQAIFGGNIPKIDNPLLVQLLLQLNGPEFVQELESFSGVDDLIADTAFRGAGFHQVRRDGRLRIHLDFNVLNNVHRRLNMFLYVTPDWDPAWQGNLELWSSKRSGPVVSIPPMFNRLVIFEQGAASWHGHPHRLQCPAAEYRRALSWYYYSKHGIDGVRPLRTTKYA